MSRRPTLRFFTETKAGEIQSRLTNDVGGIQTIVTDTASSIMPNVVIIASTVSAMLILSWQLTVFSCALTPVFIWLTTRIGKIRRTTASYTQQTMADLATLSQETLSVSGVLLTKSFGRQLRAGRAPGPPWFPDLSRGGSRPRAVRLSPGGGAASLHRHRVKSDGGVLSFPAQAMPANHMITRLSRRRN